MSASYNLRVPSVTNPTITFSNWATISTDYTAKGFVTVYYNGGTVSFNSGGYKIYANIQDEDTGSDNIFTVTPSAYESIADEPIIFSWYYDGVSLFIGMNTMPSYQ